jgi:transaldolase
VTAEKIELKVKIFGDGADMQTILNLNADPRIAGFTTNPTLMRKAGVEDYEVGASGGEGQADFLRSFF